jgi:hypothetical protein
MQEAIGKLAGMLTSLNPEAADELKELWHEYDQAETTGAPRRPFRHVDHSAATTTVPHPSFLPSSRDFHTVTLHFPLPQAAKFVKDLDKVDMALQALEYETRDKGAGTLEEFFRSMHGVCSFVRELRSAASHSPRYASFLTPCPLPRGLPGKIKSEKASALFEKVLALRKAVQGDAQDSQ